jgi:ligand-binding sensor domain-containing protein
MKIFYQYFLFLIFFILLFFCTNNIQSKNNFKQIPVPWVYSIKQHNDSIYFSTSEKGIYRFKTDQPNKIDLVAASGKIPFRSLVFKDNGTLFASSYYTGVYILKSEKLIPLLWAQYPCWSMKKDENNSLWIAGTKGIFFEKDSNMILFKEMYDAHDIAICKDKIFIAHMKGITVYDRQNSNRIIKNICKDTVFWAIKNYNDSLIIAGGLGVCLIIKKEQIIKIPVQPKNNMIWAIDKNNNNFIFLGTQKGLFRIAPNQTKAEIVAYKNKCIKSIFIDSNGILWVGTFYK